MEACAPELPATGVLGRLNVRLDDELHAGHQSRIFCGTVSGCDAAIKLTERRLSNRTLLGDRMMTVERLAADLDIVVAPLRIVGELVQPVADWLITATPWIDGEAVDITEAPAVERMGRTLARLHDALAKLPPSDLLPVAALDVVGPGSDRAGWQLLHGDFSDQNVLATTTGLRVFDFDDCGYGPTDYDLANTLYMVLFDAEVSGSMTRYETFRPPFLAGYASALGRELDDEQIDSLISIRIAALARWLDDLATAPIGIRTSSPAWRDTLRSFVNSHNDDGEIVSLRR